MLGYAGRWKSDEAVHTALDRPLDIMLYNLLDGGVTLCTVSVWGLFIVFVLNIECKEFCYVRLCW